MKLKAVNDYIVVVPTVAEKTGVLILTEQELPVQGKVVSAAEGSIKQGDIVLFGKDSGIPFPVNGVEHLILRSYEIFAIIE